MNTDTINKLIAIPKNLYSVDGRRFSLTSWHTETDLGDKPRIQATAIPQFADASRFGTTHEDLISAIEDLEIEEKLTQKQAALLIESVSFHFTKQHSSDE